MLWPEMGIEAAAQRLNNSLNDDRREVLHVHQYLLIWREARAVGCLAGVAHVNHECNCAPPNPIEPEDEMAQLQRNYIESVRMQQKIADRLERINDRSPNSHIRRAC